MKQTVEQIEERLAEIAADQAAFDARDFDAELSHAIVNGADVDALEEQQLQAERIARRLRVERQALEAALPEARVKEVEQQLELLRRQHGELKARADKLIDQVSESWDALKGPIEELGKVHGQMFSMNRKGYDAIGILPKEDREALGDLNLGAPSSARLGRIARAIGPSAQKMAGWAHMGFGPYLDERSPID